MKRQKESSDFIVRDNSDGKTRKIEISYRKNQGKKNKSVDKIPIDIDKVYDSISSELMDDNRKSRRTRNQFPDPDKSRFDEVNRLDKRFQARINKSTDDAINDFLKATGMTKKEATERAFKLLIELYDYE